MMKVKVEGFRDLEQNLFKLKGSTAKSNVRAAAQEALEPMARDMRAKAPRDSGELIESIDVSERTKPPLPKRDAFEIAVGPGRMPQAITQEFGFYSSPGQPFARPAYEENKHDAIDRFGVLLWDRVLKAIKRAAAKVARDA